MYRIIQRIGSRRSLLYARNATKSLSTFRDHFPKNDDFSNRHIGPSDDEAIQMIKYLGMKVFKNSIQKNVFKRCTSIQFFNFNIEIKDKYKKNKAKRFSFDFLQ